MMNTYGKKIIWLLLVVTIVFSAFGFAKDDCENIDTISYKWLYEDFFSADDLEIARDHLRSYCCVERKNLFTEKDFLKDWKCYNIVLWPESPYWYDHLIDVGLRKLDAEALYPEMEPDPQWKEWRDFLKNTEEVKNPESFQKAYIKYRQQSKQYLFADYKWNVSSLDNVILNQDFNLHDKYINLCFIAMAYYQSLPIVNIDIVAEWYYGKCLSMVKARIRQETSLAIMVSQYNAATLLVSGLTSYTKQFVQDRLMKLFDKFVAISSLFNTLVKQAPLSDTCTK